MVLLGGNYHWGNFPGGIIRNNFPRGNIQGVIFLGGNYRGGNRLGDNYPGGFSSGTIALEPYKTISFIWIKTVRMAFALGSHLRVSPHLRGVQPKGPTLCATLGSHLRVPS